MTDERYELEKSLVKRDRQALISDCMKCYDTIESLTIQIDSYKERLKVVEEEGKINADEVFRLRTRTIWQVLNERIEGRIDAIRFRNGGAVKLGT